MTTVEEYHALHAEEKEKNGSWNVEHYYPKNDQLVEIMKCRQHLDFLGIYGNYLIKILNSELWCNIICF